MLKIVKYISRCIYGSSNRLVCCVEGQYFEHLKKTKQNCKEFESLEDYAKATIFPFQWYFHVNDLNVAVVVFFKRFLTID